MKIASATLKIGHRKKFGGIKSSIRLLKSSHYTMSVVAVAETVAKETLKEEEKVYQYDKGSTYQP